MLTKVKADTEALLALRTAIQKVATGPEYSKDLSLDEARQAMALILDGRADPVQTAVFLIALRMKRETDDENIGILRALLAATKTTVAPVGEVVDLADPYDGYTRGLPASPFLGPVLAACGLAAVSHGLEAVGPKYGITTRKVLRAAGIDVDRSPEAAAAQLGEPDIGWAYIDQRVFCPAMHDLVALRSLIVKRPCLTTVEVLSGPIRGRRRTHLITGYVHKAYPRVYALLAREAGFDCAAIIRGVEGGIIPSLQQPANVFAYHDRGPEDSAEMDPTSIGIDRATRAVPLPPDLPPPGQSGDEIATTVDSDAAAKHAAALGLAALRGENGPTYDSLVYGAAICLHHLGRADSLASAADQVRAVLDSGQAMARFEALARA